MKIAEKGELRKRVMERVRDAREDKNREDVGDKMQAEYETFVEERAYMEGFQDAVRRGERQKGK